MTCCARCSCAANSCPACSCCVLAACCLAAVGDLEIGNAQEMGPGYVPRALAWFLLLVGHRHDARSVRGTAVPRGPPSWRPVLLSALP